MIKFQKILKIKKAINMIISLFIEDKRRRKIWICTEAKIGITLVALVISIIVLLILATVSISLVINNGILDKAKYAVNKYSDIMSN